MDVTLFEVRSPEGELLDRARCVNWPDLADKRVAHVLQYVPNALVKRADHVDLTESDVLEFDHRWHDGTWIDNRPQTA